MKKLFLMFIFLSAIVSCGGETKETNKCDGVTCSEWEQCNSENGFCEAKDGRCNAHKDCIDDYICDENHNCVEKPNICANIICSNHGICVVENNSAKCNCDNGYYPDNLNCLEHICDDNETKSISCGLNGTGVQNQKCQNQQWINEGNCEDDDICLNNETSETECGINNRGSQNLICINGQWNNDGECIDLDVCLDNNEKTENNSCGINGTGVQSFVCTEGQWEETNCLDLDICINSQTREIPCGLNGNGIVLQICELGQWQNNGICQDSDVCVNSATRLSDIVCGINGNGFYIELCSEGTWNNTNNCEDNDVCINGTTQNIACGLNNTGIQLQDCINGEWINNGECVIYSYKTGTISQIRKSENNITVGDTVKTTGTVMYVYTVTGNVKGIYIQNSANDFDGIYVYVSPAAQSTVAAGDKIEVTGVVTDYNGLREITTTIDKVTIQSSGNTLFTAKNVTVPQLGDANESMLVNLTSSPFTITSIGTGTTVNATLTDANGVSFTLRSSFFSFQTMANFAVGTTLSTIKGIVEEYTPAGGSVTFQVKPRNANDLIFLGQIICEPNCDEWETCTATNICTLKAGRCETTSHCTVQGQECNTITHTCGNPIPICNPVCDEWETCTATNICTLTTGRCEINTDCSNDAICNLTTHYCVANGNPQFANSDFSVWINDTTPANWVKGSFPSTFSKVTRSETDYALNMSGTYTTNGYLVNTDLTAVSDTKPLSISFEMNGSGKISINIACDLNADGFTAGEQKFYAIDATGIDYNFENSGSLNVYNIFNTNNEWKTFTITTGAELNDFWKSGTNCRLEIKGAKTEPFNASIDNFVINY